MLFLRRSTLALTLSLGALCVKSSKRWSQFRPENRGRLSPPISDSESHSRSSTSDLSDGTSSPSRSGDSFGFPRSKRMTPQNRFGRFIDVSSLHYTHGDEGILCMTFTAGKTSDRKYRATIYDTIFALLFGDTGHGVKRGIIQRLLRDHPGKTYLTVEPRELQAALVATMKDLPWGCRFIPAVVDGNLTDNNRSLYVFQTIKKVFPNTTMMIPYKRKDTLDRRHNPSGIRDCDDMTMHFEPRRSEDSSDEKSFLAQQGRTRTTKIMSLFKGGKLDEEEFLHQVQQRMTKLTSRREMIKFFSEDSSEESSRSTRPRKKGPSRDCMADAW